MDSAGWQLGKQLNGSDGGDGLFVSDSSCRAIGSSGDTLAGDREPCKGCGALAGDREPGGKGWRRF